MPSAAVQAGAGAAVPAAVRTWAFDGEPGVRLLDVRPFGLTQQHTAGDRDDTEPNCRPQYGSCGIAARQQGAGGQYAAERAPPDDLGPGGGRPRGGVGLGFRNVVRLDVGGRILTGGGEAGWSGGEAASATVRAAAGCLHALTTPRRVLGN